MSAAETTWLLRNFRNDCEPSAGNIPVLLLEKGLSRDFHKRQEAWPSQTNWKDRKRTGTRCWQWLTWSVRFPGATRGRLYGPGTIALFRWPFRLSLGGRQLRILQRG